MYYSALVGGTRHVCALMGEDLTRVLLCTLYIHYWKSMVMIAFAVLSVWIDMHAALSRYPSLLCAHGWFIERDSMVLLETDIVLGEIVVVLHFELENFD